MSLHYAGETTTSHSISIGSAITVSASASSACTVDRIVRGQYAERRVVSASEAITFGPYLHHVVLHISVTAGMVEVSDSYATAGLATFEQDVRGDHVAVDAYGDDILAWDDLRFPVQGINPAGSSAPPSVDDTTRPGTLLFASGATNIIAGVAQLPHAWARGTNIHPHIHWAKTTSASGGVVWQLRYAVANVSGTFGAYSDWEDCTYPVSDSDTADKHALAAWSEIDMSAHKESAIILWQIQRKHDHASDDYAANARLLEVDFHYQRNKSGTQSEIPLEDA